MERELRASLREAAAGLVSASLTAPLCIGAGILAFSPLGPAYTPHGALAGLYGAVVGGAVAALARRSSFVVTYPTTPICAIQAGIGASVLPLCGDVPDFLLAMALCLIASGLWQALLALSGVARVIRWVPHPVMAGFVSGVAVFIGWHQLPLLVGHRSVDEMVHHGLAQPHPVAAIFGIALVVLIVALPRVTSRVPALLVGLVAGGVLFHLVRMAWPGADLGPMVGGLPVSLFDSSAKFTAGGLRALVGRPGLLGALLTGSMTLAIVGTLDTFFALRTAAFVGNIPVAPRRDVLGQGLANIATSFAGVAVSTSLSVSMANHHAGGRTRLSTLSSAGTLLLAGLVFPRVITLLPLVVIAAVLIAVSSRLLDRWCFVVLREVISGKDAARRRRALRDALVIVAVFLATVVGKPVAGVMVGIGLSGLLFVVDMSRPVLARRRDGTKARSKRIRGPAEHAALRAQSRHLQVLELQGALFFGNAQALASDLDDTDADVSVVILDCRRVRDIDTTGLAVLDQVASRYARAGRRLLVAGPSQEWVDRTFTAAGTRADYVLPSLEMALDTAEEELLSRWRSAGADGAAPDVNAPTIATTLGQLGPKLQERFQLLQLPAGSVLCRTGDPADRMWVLRRGIVRVESRHGSGAHLLTRLGPGAMIGEIGVLEHGTRSADVVADAEVEVYLLTRDDLSRVMAEDPETGQAILVAVARQLARRLREVSGELGETRS